MYDYFFFIFFILSLFNIKLKGLDGFFKDYMSLENTGSIKGIFVWIIIFCHKMEYGIKKKYIFILIIKSLHQNIVAMFLFYSGFGIYESFKKKGINYSRSLLNKSITIYAF